MDKGYAIHDFCLSVRWGWYAKLMRSFVPLSLNNSCQNWLMKRGSLSETKLRGMPRIFPVMSMNVLATLEAVYCNGNMPKWTPFKKRSTTTKMTEWSRKLGRPTIKFRERSSQGRVGTDKGHSNLGEHRWLYFVYWHRMQLAMYWWTSCFILAQVKFFQTRANVFMTPVCPPVGVEWNLARIFEMYCAPSSSQMRPFYKIKSCQRRQSEWLWGLSRIFYRYLRNSWLVHSFAFKSAKTYNWGLLASKDFWKESPVTGKGHLLPNLSCRRDIESYNHNPLNAQGMNVAPGFGKLAPWVP